MTIGGAGSSDSMTVNDDTLAIRAHKRSIANTQAGDKAEWLALFADDAEVFDPVGPSNHDPEGRGFIGKTRIAEFWDLMIAPADLLLVSHKRIACGEYICAANVTSASRVGDLKVATEMMVIYEVNEAGLIISLRAHWDVDKTAEQLV